MLAELRAIAALFPAATVCGDDWQWPGVRRAVLAFAAEAAVEVESHPKENWWLLQKPPPPSDERAKEGAPTAKRLRVEFTQPEGEVKMADG